MNFQRKKVAIALGIGGVALVAGGTASAQDIRVNVTGTNIKRVDSETSAPIETITREDIQASGLQTIQDVVRQITANNNGGIAPSFTNGFSASGSAVSLRGLGPNNTLVLVNGRRLANFGLADDGHASYPDLGQLPFDAVERIEVLKDGASAIYGSDAVAGVVNVILRQQYTGFTATATGGTTTGGEGNQYRVLGHRRHRRPDQGPLQRVRVRRLPEAGRHPEQHRPGLHRQQRLPVLWRNRQPRRQPQYHGYDHDLPRQRAAGDGDRRLARTRSSRFPATARRAI